MKATLLLSTLVFSSHLLAATINHAAAANGATATSSSIYQNLSSFVPANAIDGTTSTFFSSWGPGQAPHWFEVTFAAPAFIDTINITNRIGCCPERLTNFRVSLLSGGAAVFSGDYFTGGGFPNPLLSIGGVNQLGDTVRVEFLGVPGSRGGEDYLHFSEIEALSSVPEPSTYAMGLAGLAACFFGRKRLKR